ncbi:hypothetical protein BJV74DRAFT_302646 [Russula compacta]|nr:hypothetical protein BJV74DRAFT_302646 [Russula compacta]
MIEHEEVLRPVSLEASLLTATTPNERLLICERLSNAPPRPALDTVSSTASSTGSGDQREILFPIPVDDLNGAHPPHASRSRPESPILAAPLPPAQAPSVLPSDSSLPDTMDQDTPAPAPAVALSSPSSCSRAASSALTALDDEQSSSTPPRASPPRDNTGRCPASSPLSAPPSSPSPEQRRRESSLSPSSPPAAGTVAGTKRHAPAESHPNVDADADVDAVPSVFVLSAAPAPPEHARARARVKRRRRNSDSDDMPWRDRKKLPWASTPAQEQQQPPCPAASASASTSTSSPIPAPPPPRASSSPSSSTPTPTATTTTATTTTVPTSTYTPTRSASPTTDPNPGDAPDDDKVRDDDEDRSCPHPALLGILIEALALSRASSLPLSTLTRTTPALADYPPAALTSTLAWAVRSRILGSVRSSGEALPPSYFYDPAVDPDRERGELLRGLMPRAGKRRETMKYKQYYWAPVVVGRGRTRTWDVDWEE